MKYFNLFKTAAPKDKIRKYNITDKYQQAFIQRYENDIDWNGFKAAKADDRDATQFNQLHLTNIIDEKINVLIDEVDEENPNNAFFFKPEEIDVEQEIQDNQFHPQIQQAIEIYRKNPEAAKKQIADILNKTKDDVITSWLKYVMEENDVYKNNSAFQYLILSDVFKSARKPSKNAPLSLNAEVLAGIYEGIKGDTNVNLAKIYEKELKASYLESSEIVATGEKDGWIRIPSKRNDPENYEANEKKLRDLSQGTGWCTGRGMEKNYLPEGDFWILLENGKAVVAVRFVGSRVVEIQGYSNTRPYKYFSQIEKLFDEKNFDKVSKHYRELLEIKKNNESFANQDADAMAKFIEKVALDPSDIYKLDKKYWTEDVKNACIQGYKRWVRSLNRYASTESIQERVQHFTNSPDFVQNDESFKNEFLKEAKTYVSNRYQYRQYKAFPDFIQEDQAFKNIVLENYMLFAEDDAVKYVDAPTYVTSNNEYIQKVIEGYKRMMLDTDQYSYSVSAQVQYQIDTYGADIRDYGFLKIPDFVMDKIAKDENFKKNLIEQYVKAFDGAYNPAFIHKIPLFIREESAIQKAWLHCFVRYFEENPDIKSDSQHNEPLPEKFANNRLILNARAKGYAKRVYQRPEILSDLQENAPNFAKHPIVQRAWRRGLVNKLAYVVNKLAYDVTFFDELPENLQQNENVQNYLKHLYFLKLQYLQYPSAQSDDFRHLLISMPDFVCQEKKVQTEIITQYKRFMENNPNLFELLPNAIQDLVKNDEELKENRIKAWIKVLNAHAPAYINRIPDDIKDRRDIQNAVQQGVISFLHTTPKYFDDRMPPYFKKLPAIQDAYIIGCAYNNVQYADTEYPQLYYHSPKSVTETPLYKSEVKRNHQNSLKYYLFTDHKKFAKVPDFVLADQEFQQQIDKVIMLELKSNSKSFEYLPLEYQQNSKYQEVAYNSLLEEIKRYPWNFNLRRNMPRLLQIYPKFFARLKEDLKDEQDLKWKISFDHVNEQVLQDQAKKAHTNGWYTVCKHT